MSARSFRLHAWLTAALVLACVLAANHLAREHFRARIDLSEDRLFAPSPVARKALGELRDVLAVKAYFTGRVELGPVQIAKRRLVEQLEEYAGFAAGRMELTFVDPNRSSEARAEAEALGIVPVPLRLAGGRGSLTQDVYLGLTLRHRGRETVLPFVLPQSLEFELLSAVATLARDELLSVGFLVGDGRGAADDGFATARQLFAGRYRVRELPGIDEGAPIPDDLAVLVVARPSGLHARAAFALDQYLQGGGHALVLLDPVRVDLGDGRVERVASGLEDVLGAFGVVAGDGLVWDGERCNALTTYSTVEVDGEQRRVEDARVPYPFWPTIGEDGLARDVPVTGRQPGVDLFWAVPLGGVAPAGVVERSELAWSGERSFVVADAAALEIDPAALNARAATLLAGGGGGVRGPHALLVSVAGTVPSPFAGGAPAPYDEIAEVLFDERVRRATEAGAEPPLAAPTGTTDEPVRSGEREARLVVCGDADGFADGRYFGDRNRMLLASLVDWLAQEEGLVELRARRPRERALRDLLEEARRERGLDAVLAATGTVGEPEIARLETEAEDAAARARGLYALAATVGSFVLALLLSLAWRLYVRRTQP